MDARRNEWREKDGDRSVARESGLKRCNDAKPSSLSRPGLAWRTNCSLARSLACPRVHTYVSNTQRVVLHVRALMETEDHARERFVSRPETSSRASAYLHACHYLLKQTRVCVCVHRVHGMQMRLCIRQSVISIESLSIYTPRLNRYLLISTSRSARQMRRVPLRTYHGDHCSPRFTMHLFGILFFSDA